MLDLALCYVKNPKTIFNYQAALIKDMSTCPQLISVMLKCENSGVRNPKTIFSCQVALTKVMSTCPQL